MPSLKQVAILARQHLKQSLLPCGCAPIKGTIGMWTHDERSTKFCLSVDDFSIKNWSKSDADHLCNSVGANFRYAVDKEGKKLLWTCAFVELSVGLCRFIDAETCSHNTQQT